MVGRSPRRRRSGSGPCETRHPEAPIGLGVFVATGEGRAVDSWSRRLDGGALHGLAGDAERVADTLHSYEAFGVTRCTLSELVPGTYEHLASVLV
jgi:hypothetical protein